MTAGNARVAGAEVPRVALRVRDIMTRVLWTSPPDSSLVEVVDIMDSHRVSSVPIVDGHRLVGLVTEAEIDDIADVDGGVRRSPLTVLSDMWHGRDGAWIAKAAGATAGDVMTAPVDVASPGESVHSAARRLIDAGISQLPVIENGRLVGIVARSDIISAMNPRPESREDAPLC